MRISHGEYILSDDPGLLQPERIHALLGTTYWAKDRSLDEVRTSLSHSLTVRCVTDYVTFFMLNDVVVDESCRGEGLGKALVAAVLDLESIHSLRGLLFTRDAFTLYERFGFKIEPERCMVRPADERSGQ